MPTKCTGQQLLNPQGRKAWREDGPTRGQDLWEMHGVWVRDSAKNTGAVLHEKYFVSDPRSHAWQITCFPISRQLGLHLELLRDTSWKMLHFYTIHSSSSPYEWKVLAPGSELSIRIMVCCELC